MNLYFRPIYFYAASFNATIASFFLYGFLLCGFLYGPMSSAQTTKLPPKEPVQSEPTRENQRSSQSNGQDDQQAQSPSEEESVQTVIPSEPNLEPATEPASLAHRMSFAGFIDFRFNNYTVDGANGNPNSGFALDDAAFQISYEDGPLSVYFDLPIRKADSFVDIDGDGDADAGVSNSNKMEIAENRAQAFLRYQLTPTFAYTLGQFDSYYGYETNDSNNRFFANEGLIYTQATPNTHAGLMLDFFHQGFSSKLIVANPSERGTLGCSTDTSSSPPKCTHIDDNYEYGVLLGYANAMTRVSLGYLARSVENVAGKNENHELLNVVVGFSVGPVDLDLEYDHVKDPQKDMNSDNKVDSAGKGFLAHLVFNSGELFALGLRYEKTDDHLSRFANYEETQYALGIHMRANDNLLTRIEYGHNKFEATKGAKEKEARIFTISSVVQF